MFMELNRVKDEMIFIKNKTGIKGNAPHSYTNHNQMSGFNLNPSNDLSGTKMVLGINSGLGGANMMRRDERRYGEIPANSSAGSSLAGYFENIPS